MDLRKLNVKLGKNFFQLIAFKNVESKTLERVAFDLVIFSVVFNFF